MDHKCSRVRVSKQKRNIQIEKVDKIGNESERQFIIILDVEYIELFNSTMKSDIDNDPNNLGY